MLRRMAYLFASACLLPLLVGPWVLGGLLGLRCPRCGGRWRVSPYCDGSDAFTCHHCRHRWTEP